MPPRPSRGGSRVLEKLQLGARRVQRKPVPLVLRNRLLVSVRHCLRCADENLEICEGRVRPVISLRVGLALRGKAHRAGHRVDIVIVAFVLRQMTSEMHQGERIDPGIVVTRIGAEATGVAIDRGAQQRILVGGVVAHLIRRPSRLPPSRHPCILVHATEQRPGFRIGRVKLQRITEVLARSIQRVSRDPTQG